jgi:hypothetical protein
LILCGNTNLPFLYHLYYQEHTVYDNMQTLTTSNNDGDINEIIKINQQNFYQFKEKYFNLAKEFLNFELDKLKKEIPTINCASWYILFCVNFFLIVLVLCNFE